jgi:hypothetical protein
MSEFLASAAEKMGVPEALVKRSAEARAKAAGASTDDILSAWAGGEAAPAAHPHHPAAEPETAEPGAAPTPSRPNHPPATPGPHHAVPAPAPRPLPGSGPWRPAEHPAGAGGPPRASGRERWPGRRPAGALGLLVGFFVASTPEDSNLAYTSEFAVLGDSPSTAGTGLSGRGVLGVPHPGRPTPRRRRRFRRCDDVRHQPDHRHPPSRPGPGTHRVAGGDRRRPVRRPRRRSGHPRSVASANRPRCTRRLPDGIEMSEFLASAAEKMGVPEALVRRSAEARAKAAGASTDDILAAWAGGEAAPAAAAPPPPEPANPEPEAATPAAEAPSETRPSTPTQAPGTGRHGRAGPAPPRSPRKRSTIRWSSRCRRWGSPSGRWRPSPAGWRWRSSSSPPSDCCTWREAARPAVCDDGDVRLGVDVVTGGLENCDGSAFEGRAPAAAAAPSSSPSARPSTPAAPAVTASTAREASVRPSAASTPSSRPVSTTSSGSGSAPTASVRPGSDTYGDLAETRSEAAE